MDEKQAAVYLNENHSEHFSKVVTAYDVKRWIGQGRIVELSTEELDNAIATKRIPPKRGRPARFSECDKGDIIAACEVMPQGQVAKKFGCDPSYVSMIVRGLR